MEEWIEFLGSKVPISEFTKVSDAFSFCGIRNPSELLHFMREAPDSLSNKLEMLSTQELGDLKRSLKQIGFRNGDDLTSGEFSCILFGTGAIDKEFVEHMKLKELKCKDLHTKDVRSIIGTEVFQLLEKSKEVLRQVKFWSLLGIPNRSKNNCYTTEDAKMKINSKVSQPEIFLLMQNGEMMAVFIVESFMTAVLSNIVCCEVSRKGISNTDIPNGWWSWDG